MLNLLSKAPLRGITTNSYFRISSSIGRVDTKSLINEQTKRSYYENLIQNKTQCMIHDQQKRMFQICYKVIMQNSLQILSDKNKKAKRIIGPKVKVHLDDSQYRVYWLCLCAECAPQQQEDLKRNQLTQRAFVLQYPANDPCEDRFNCVQFQNFNGFYAAVFDGHGGWQVSEYAMRKLHLYLDEDLKKAKNDNDIKKAIVNAYTKVENDWYELAKSSFDKGFPSTAYMGSCALIAIVHDNKLYIANAGDSKGVLLRKKEDGSYESLKVSTTFNANKKYEQERLKKQFKDESDIVVCKRPEEKACYVKGSLMPTRAIGDLRLKKSEFNFHNYERELGYRNPIPKYTGPYITYEPDIQVIELNKNDQWLVLASDGLWDEISRKQAAEMAKEHDSDMKKLAAQFFDKALENASKEKNISREFISQLAPGHQKRMIHDDITILILNLKNQVQ